MIQVVKTLLITIGGLMLLAVLAVSILVYSLFLAVSNPSHKECIRIAERFLGCNLGREYDFMEYKARYNHPDRPLHFVVKIPDDQFRKVVEYCDNEANMHKTEITTEDKNYYTMESPIYFVNKDYGQGKIVRGFFKTRQVEYGEPVGLLVFGQSIFVDVDNKQIKYDHTGY